MRLICFITVIFVFHSCSQQAVQSTDQLTGKGPENSRVPAPITTDTLLQLEVPALRSDDSIIQHTGFSLVYNEQHEQASWVAYELTLEKTIPLVKRTNRFKPDPKVLTLTANNNDYAGSNFDRGHLAPAADMSWSAEAMAESFYYSNISPQDPGFNRGIWKKLEELVRYWATQDTSIYIVTGPVLSEGLPTIGTNKVSVPGYFYKVILVYKKDKTTGIGFILPNERSTQLLTQFAVTIDSVQQMTGIDFFHLLPDGKENLIEKNLCLECWSWTISGR